MSHRARAAARVGVMAFALSALPVSAQVPVDGEVRQLVTFLFQPGRSAEVYQLYRESAIPLYRQNPAMLSVRGLREVESPTPLDLVLVSAFHGMEGMDESNGTLRRLSAEAGTSIGGLYGQIAALSQHHYDEFIEMLPLLGGGDPSASRLVAIVRYRLVPGDREAFFTDLAQVVVPWERARGQAVSTGRFLLSDGWDVMRILGFQDLAAYHKYWSDMRIEPWFNTVDSRISVVQRTVVAPVPEFSVR